MMEKGKISAFQMGIMMTPAIISTAVLVLPGTTGKFAKNDMWLSPVWASFIGFLAVYLAYRLHRLYPKQTMIQYSVQIMGKIPGKIVGLMYLIYILVSTGIILRGYAEFLVGTFLVQTPISVVMGTMILVCAVAVRGGIEVIARATQFFVPLYLFSFLFLILLPMGDFELKYILPFMAHGIMPSVKGALVPMGWFSQFFMITFLLPFLTDQEKGRKWGMISVVSVLLIMVMTNLAALLLLGGNVVTAVYPLMNLARYISIADFFENLEAIVMALWMIGLFMKISLYYYVTVLSTAQWMELSDYRPIVGPIGFLMVLIGFWNMPNFVEFARYTMGSSVSYTPFTYIVIPLLLLLLAVLRKRKKDLIP